MITGEYIVDCVIFSKYNYETVGMVNAILSNVSVNSSAEFYNLALETIKKSMTPKFR